MIIINLYIIRKNFNEEKGIKNHNLQQILKSD